MVWETVYRVRPKSTINAGKSAMLAATNDSYEGAIFPYFSQAPAIFELTPGIRRRRDQAVTLPFPRRDLKGY